MQQFGSTIARRVLRGLPSRGPYAFDSSVVQITRCYNRTHLFNFSSTSGNPGSTSNTSNTSNVFLDEDDFERANPSARHEATFTSKSKDSHQNLNKTAWGETTKGGQANKSTDNDDDQINQLIREQLLMNKGRPDFSQGDSNINLFQFMEMQKQYMTNPDLFDADELERMLNDRESQISSNGSSSKAPASDFSGDEEEFSSSDIEVLTDSELKAVLKNFQLPTTGSRKELEDRLRPLYMDLVKQFQASNANAKDIEYEGDETASGEDDDDEEKVEYNASDLNAFRNNNDSPESKTSDNTSNKINKSTKSKIDLEIENEEREFYKNAFQEFQREDLKEADSDDSSSASDSSTDSETGSISMAEYEILSFICSKLEVAKGAQMPVKELGLVLSKNSIGGSSYLDIIKGKHDTLGRFIEKNNDIFELVGHGPTAKLQMRKQ